MVFQIIRDMITKLRLISTQTDQDQDKTFGKLIQQKNDQVKMEQEQPKNELSFEDQNKDDEKQESLEASSETDSNASSQRSSSQDQESETVEEDDED